jgi:uncharacterized protein YbjT (DUF2867 family)
VQKLRERGHEVRALSRRHGDGLTTGNLLTGAGIAAAVEGVDTVVHLSTGRRDVDAAHNLIEASRDSGVGKLVVISIVGIDDIPYDYYRQKLAIEKLTTYSRIPFTILRATQFHGFVVGLLAAQRISPVIFAPTFSLQPVEVAEVATRMADLAEQDAAGRVPDIGGPEALTVRELATIWAGAVGSRRKIVDLRLPGKMMAGFSSGASLVPGVPYGKRTFAEFVGATANK